MPSPLTRITPEQRAGQALQNLMMADVPAAARSLISPDNLTPQERDAFLKDLGLAESPWAGVYRMLTNPALIGSLALCYAFPIPSAKNMFKLAKKVEGFSKRFPILGRLTSAWSLFSGTEVPGILSRITRDRDDWRSRYGIALASALKQFENRTGRSVSSQEQKMVSAWLDGLHLPLRGFQGKNGVIQIGRGVTAFETDAVGALLPNLEQRMSSPLLNLAKDTRKVLDGMWDEGFAKLEDRKAILEAFGRLRKSGFVTEEMEAMVGLMENPQKIEWYFPHRAQRTDEEVRHIMQRLTAGVTKEKHYAALSQHKMTTWLGREFHKRNYVMIPSFQDLHELGNLVDPVEYKKVLDITKHRVLDFARKEGTLRTASLERMAAMPFEEMLVKYHTMLPQEEAFGMLGAIASEMPTTYSLKMAPVLSQYVHSTANTYAWTIKQGGTDMAEQLFRAKAVAEAGEPWARRRAEMLENTYIPIAMGKGTLRTSIKSQVWDHEMNKLSTLVDRPVFKKVLGEKLTGFLKDNLSHTQGAWSFLNAQRSVSSYFYLSTLGLNPGSAFKNLFQLVLTTGPVLGYRTTAQGVSEAMRKSHKYFALRMGPRKLGHEEAIRSAFKEYGASGLAASPITDEAINNAYRNAYEIAALPTGKLAKMGEKISRAMMSIFTSSESTVRISSFEAALIHAKRSKLPMEEAIRYARDVVENTQFPTGPSNVPYVLLDVGSMWKQLAQFPLRTAEFATSTAWRLGAAEKNVLGVNPGTFARMVAGSTVAYELGEMMGLDMGDALLGGAVPTFREWGPLSPLPVVPPMVQILGASAMGLASGDFTEMVRSTPLLMPGGVGVAKWAGFLPPGVPGADVARKAAHWVGKNYADYEAPAPDGRIPVYTGRGSLRGFYTPWELVRAGMGIRGGDLDTERELMEVLVKNRDQIREARRGYAEALFANDPGRAAAIARDYQKRFGHPLPVSEKDVETVQKRRMTTRLEQMVLTLPPEARQVYVDWIAQTYGANTQDFLGVDPAMLGLGGRGGGQARAQSRGQTVRPGAGQPGPYLNEMSPYDRVEPYQIGRQQSVPRSPLGF